jgi:type VI protein secretion system component VasK
MGSRVAASILVVFGWLIFLVVWLFFYAGKFTLLENLGIVIVAFLVGVAILAAAWASWGMKYGKNMHRLKHMEHEKRNHEAREAKESSARKRSKKQNT